MYECAELFPVDPILQIIEAKCGQIGKVAFPTGLPGSVLIHQHWSSDIGQCDHLKTSFHINQKYRVSRSVVSASLRSHGF